MAPPEPKRRKTDTNLGPTISDPRFANIQSDPRYRLPGKNQKIKLDKRFARVVGDDEFSRKAKVDRYGRPIKTDLEKKRLKRKYEFEEEESEVSDEADDDEEVQKELQRVEESRDLLREGKDVSSSEDESSSEEDSELEEDAEEEVGLGQQKTDVPLGEVSSRMAVVNLDWDNIRAEDLMAVFSSFLPPTGRLLKVAIYPSEFGKERMEREETEGPPKEIFAKEDDDEDESEEDEQKIKDALIKPDDGSEFDSKALRQYQLDRLRYFYAVLTFSDPEAAKAVYDKVDGTEYLSTANFFDLRFIPNETDFTDDKTREECGQLPAGYKPNEFVTDALQHSKVKLTWDAEDKGRKEAQARAFRGSRQDIDENDLKAYLGSDNDSDSGEDGIEDDKEQDLEKPSKKEVERQRMRALLGLSAEPVKKTKKEKNMPTGDIQITFSSGLAGAAVRHDSSDEEVTTKKPKRSVFANSPEPEETTMEKYVRREKERKKRRKESMKNPSATTAEDDTATKPQPEDTTADDLGFNDPFFAEPSAKEARSSTKLRKEERLKKRHEREAEEKANAKSRAELELLMADDDNNNNTNTTDPNRGHTVRHFDMNEIEKAEKAARKNKSKSKSKSKHDSNTTATSKDDFNLDTSDPRFTKIFENHEFAIDPSNPRFKGTNAMKSLLEEGRKRKGKVIDGDRLRDERNSSRRKYVSRKEQGRKEKDGAGARGEQDEVMGLVEKIKRKNQA